MIHLDTHVVVWLYAGQLERFPPAVTSLLERERLVICPLVQLELQYLFEVGRVKVQSAEVVGDLEARVGLTLAETPLRAVVAQSLELTWTRDPFDRLIAANALVEQAQLVTADRTLRDHAPCAVWA